MVMLAPARREPDESSTIPERDACWKAVRFSELDKRIKTINTFILVSYLVSQLEIHFQDSLILLCHPVLSRKKMGAHCLSRADCDESQSGGVALDITRILLLVGTGLFFCPSGAGRATGAVDSAHVST